MEMLTLGASRPGKPMMATIGFFDGVHLGHRYLIERLRTEAEVRGLGSLLVTFGEHPRHVMQDGFRPELLTTYGEKCCLLAETGVDALLTLDFTPELARMSARAFMEEVLCRGMGVRALSVGYDHRFGHDRSEGFEDYVAYGGVLGVEVVRAEAFVMDGVQVSSSRVRSCIKEGEVGVARRFLGRNYSLSGVVVGGFHVGRELGFPTANICPSDEGKLIPGDGVYAVLIGFSDGEKRVGMLNIGCRPTLDNGSERTIEVNVFDFEGDLYGRELTLEFVERLREEKKFGSRAELVHRLREDERMVRRILADEIRKNNKL